MRMDLQKLVREGGILDVRVPLGPLSWDQGTDLDARPCALKGRVARVRRGFDFEASLSGGLTLECVRCLKSFPWDLRFDFHLIFVPEESRPRSGEVQIQEADCDLYLCPDGKVDLSDLAREQIYLHIPLKPVCHDLCRGLCKMCGEDLNRGPCTCDEPANVPVV